MYQLGGPSASAFWGLGSCLILGLEHFWDLFFAVFGVFCARGFLTGGDFSPILLGGLKHTRSYTLLESIIYSYPSRLQFVSMCPHGRSYPFRDMTHLTCTSFRSAVGPAVGWAKNVGRPHINPTMYAGMRDWHQVLNSAVVRSALIQLTLHTPLCRS